MNALALQCQRIKDSDFDLGDKLELLSMIVEGIKLGDSDAPQLSELYEDLRKLVEKTTSGCRIDHLKPENSDNGFRTCQILSEEGADLGNLYMLYLRKPIPCYYLVYVEVKHHFRQEGLGSKIISYYVDFLEKKKAVGILDNIIPSGDPAYHIYAKHNFFSVQELGAANRQNYMFYIPSELDRRQIKRKLPQTLHHIERKKELVAMRDNEAAVKKTIAELSRLLDAIQEFFSGWDLNSEETEIMRFMYTRFVTKLNAFKRSLKKLFGYTGGESLDQIVIPPPVKELEARSYLPKAYSADARIIFCSDEYCASRLPPPVIDSPAAAIDSLPDYQRPILTEWLKKNKAGFNSRLTINDILELGFDPTRLKEICLDGEDYIFERVQLWQVDEIMKRQKILHKFIAGQKTFNPPFLGLNPIVIIIEDRGNAYLLRKKIKAIHHDEALEQLDGVRFARLNENGRLSREIKIIARKIHEAVNEPNVKIFVPWNLSSNMPALMIDPVSCSMSIEKIWLA